MKLPKFVEMKKVFAFILSLMLFVSCAAAGTGLAENKKINIEIQKIMCYNVINKHSRRKNMTSKDFDYIIELKNKWLDMAQMVDEKTFNVKSFEYLVNVSKFI